MSHNKAVWMARLLYRFGPMTKEEIAERWRSMDENGQPMATSTFYDNRRLLAERYGLHVNRRAGRYELDEADRLNPLFYDCMLYGPDQPLGSEHYPAIADAIRCRRELLVRYNPYDKAGYEMLLHPYTLRCFRQRYYVVGFSLYHGEVRTFGLDRVAHVRPTGAFFESDASFDANAYYRYSFGIYGGTHLQPEHVVLEADATVAPYLSSLPLHASQRSQALPGGRLRIELDLALTPDFVAEVLSYGHALRVLSPEALCRRLAADPRAVHF